MLRRFVFRAAFIGSVLIAVSFSAAAAGIVRIPIVTDFGWNTGPDYYANANAHLKARFMPGTAVRTWASGKIHDQNAIYDWQREACDLEHFALMIVGAEQPHWVVTVENDFSLDVQADGIGTSLFVPPGHWWLADAKTYHFCQIQGVTAHWGGAQHVLGFDYPEETTWCYGEVSDVENIVLQKKTKAEGQLKADPELTSTTVDVPGAVVYLYFQSRSNGRLKERPYDPIQLQKISLDINTMRRKLSSDCAGLYGGTATAYDGDVLIGTVTIP